MLKSELLTGTKLNYFKQNILLMEMVLIGSRLLNNCLDPVRPFLIYFLISTSNESSYPTTLVLLFENYPLAHSGNKCCSEYNETFFCKTPFLGFFHRDHSREKVEDPYSPEQKQLINGYILRLNEILLKKSKRMLCSTWVLMYFNNSRVYKEKLTLFSSLCRQWTYLTTTNWGLSVFFCVRHEKRNWKLI